MKDWETYEHFCIDYHREKYKHITWHWYNTPEEHLENSGYIHSFNKHRLERLRKSKENYVNGISDYGMEGLAMELHSQDMSMELRSDSQKVIYHGLQMKYYQGKNKVSANDIGTFITSLFCRLMVKNKDSRGYLYSSCGLEINLSEDLQNNPLIIYEKKSMELCSEDQRSVESSSKEKETVKISENNESSYPLRPYQLESLKELHNFDNEEIYEDYEERSIDTSISKIKTLSIFCGGGKTLITGNYLKDKSFESIVVIAPLKISVDNLYTRLTPFLPNYKNLIVDSDYTIGTTDPEIISKFIKDKSKPSIIYTTFDSAENLLDNLLSTSDNESFKNGFILADEVHNLVGKEKLCNFVNKFNDGLLLSATIPEELYENINATNVYSYNISQAINDSYCVDYKIWIPLIIQKEAETTLKSIEIPEGFPENELCEKVLFLVTGMLKTGAKRCIVYLNSIEECDIFNELFSKVCSNYHGITSWSEKIDCTVSLEKRRQLLEEFQSEKEIKNTLHILSSVRILDEAIDVVRCDSEFICSVGENSSDIRCVQRLFRGGRLDKCNVNKINNLFIWTKEIPKVVNMLSLLRDSDPNFHKKVSILDGSYDSSGKSNVERIELKNIELKSLEKDLTIKCLSLMDYHILMLNKIKDFKEKYGVYPKIGGIREESKENNLAYYISSRRKNKRRNELKQEIESLILSILPDWSWNPLYDKHILTLNQIKEFVKKYGEYPKKYGKRDEENESKLARYIQHRRDDKRKNILNTELEILILSIFPDWIWEPYLDQHTLSLNQIKEFVKKYGEYPKNYGVRDEDNESKLSVYISSRRNDKKLDRLTEEMERMILKILPDFPWNPIVEGHIKKINSIKNFILKYGEYPKARGLREEGDESRLYNYISDRRRDKKKNKLETEIEKLISEKLPDLKLI